MEQPKPLHGVRVLELARILAGPWSGQLLADLGADVVKVERPGSGDDTRSWGPPFVEVEGDERLEAAYFHSCNRGKRSIAIDFESAEGQAVIRRLASRADILIENFKVGGLKKYGLDFESLQGINPRLIYCSITGFGQSGPYASRAGYDFMIQGLGGVMDITGPPDGEPQKVGIAIADIFTGVYATVGILAALHRRQLTDLGGYVDMALLDVQTSILANQAMNYLISQQPPRRMGNAHPNIVPYQVFPVADGHVIIAVGNDRQFAKFVAVLGHPSIAADPRFLTNADRVSNRTTLVELLTELMAKFTRAGLLSALERVGVPAGPINSIEDVFADPQVLARGMRMDIAAARAKAGTIPSVCSPIVLDGQRMVATRAAPSLDAHKEAILSGVGWDD